MRVALSGFAVMLGLMGGVLGTMPVAHAAAVITKGDLAVSVGSTVDEYTPTGTFVQHLVTSADGLGLATGTAFDGNGNLYVTDFSNNQILERNWLTGIVTVFATSATLGGGHSFNSPESIVFDKGYQHMYVSDANRKGPGGGINVIDMATGRDSAFYQLPSSSGSDGVGESDWLAFDASSNLYMTNEDPVQGVMRVDMTTGDIQQPSFIANLPNDGYALSFDKNGNLWVGDTNSILEYDASGALVQQITNPNFSLIFAAVFNTTGDQFFAGDLGNGQVYRYDLSGNLLGSFSAGGGVDGLSIAGAAIPPNSTGPQDMEVAGSVSNEPSIAVDPRDPNHVVVGYNHWTQLGFSERCSYSETTDGGVTWKQSLLPGIAHSMYGTDPTVRFASDGTLYYSCQVETPWTHGTELRQRDLYELLYKSVTGQAAKFSPNPTAFDQQHQKCFGKQLADCDKLAGTPMDHPSLTIIHQPGGKIGTATRAAVCWTKIEGDAPARTFTTWVDPDGTVGERQRVGDGWYCFMSGTPTMPTVSWTDLSGTFEAVKASADGGAHWTPLLSVPTPNVLSLYNIDNTFRDTPVALTVSDGAGGLRVIEAVRTNGHPSLFVTDSASNFTKSTPLPGNGDAAFLPGVGNCQNLIGAYERTSAGYGYTVWGRDHTGNYIQLFATPKDMGLGYTLERDTTYQRIGDYTDAGCVGSTAWVAWTDSHNTNLNDPSNVTIHVVRLAIP